MTALRPQRTDRWARIGNVNVALAGPGKRCTGPRTLDGVGVVWQWVLVGMGLRVLRQLERGPDSEKTSVAAWIADESAATVITLPELAPRRLV